MAHAIVRQGFLLITLALIAGLFIPAMAVPRLGLSAHTVGVMGGMLLIAVGAVWSHFELSETQRRWLHTLWLSSSYLNWLACLAAALLGTGRTTPLASAGAVGGALEEALVAILFATVALVSFSACGLSLWGLRNPGR
ncbi:MAG: hypothetical protein ACX93N_04210 [Pseudohaliea sp.]